MTRAALLTLALVTLSGCLQAPPIERLSDPGSNGGELASPGEYRLVLVDGRYKRETNTFGVCGFNSLPEIDEVQKTIMFHNERPPADARALVLAIVWDQSECGVAVTEWVTLDEPTGLARIDLLGLGTVGVEFLEDGSIRIDGQPLAPGGLTIDARGRDWNATAAFRDAGIWPADGVRLA